jgi:hypothetical protein
MRNRLFSIITACAIFFGCDAEQGQRKVPAAKKTRKAVAKHIDEGKNMSRDQVLPRVVHRSYFEVTGIPDVTVTPDKFGLVRPLGSDLYSFLALREKDMIRNLHPEDLTKLGLDEESAWALARANLRAMAADGKTIRPQVTRTPSGNDWAVWLGNEFTSSCVLLPDFYRWAKEQLKADSFLVRIASTQLILILRETDREHIPDFDRYLEKVLEGSRNRISDDWFLLTESKLAPLTPDQPPPQDRGEEPEQ